MNITACFTTTIPFFCYLLLILDILMFSFSSEKALIYDTFYRPMPIYFMKLQSWLGLRFISSKILSTVIQNSSDVTTWSHYGGLWASSPKTFGFTFGPIFFKFIKLFFL